MSKYKFGEFIDLVWECGVEEYHVKGHIYPQAALEILQREFPGMKFTMPKAAYGRFEVHGGAETEQVLTVYADGGRGKFPLMVALPAGYEVVEGVQDV